MESPSTFLCAHVPLALLTLYEWEMAVSSLSLECCEFEGEWEANTFLDIELEVDLERLIRRELGGDVVKLELLDFDDNCFKLESNVAFNFVFNVGDSSEFLLALILF